MKGVSLFPVLILLIVFSPLVVPGQKRPAAHSVQPKLKSTMRKASAPANTLSTKEQSILDEINLVRSNPSQYIHYLEDFRRYYHGKELRFPDGQSVITMEGVGALDEAYKLLALG